MKIKENNILKTYENEGKSGREYYNCMKYLKLMNISKKSMLIKKLAKRLYIDYGTVLHWVRRDRVPCGIKTIIFLKKKNLLPFSPNEKVARLVGFLHGDGFLTENLRQIGFVSNDLKLLKKIKKDFEDEFRIKGEIKKKRDVGDIEYIHGKRVIVKRPTFEIDFHKVPIHYIHLF